MLKASPVSSSTPKTAAMEVPSVTMMNWLESGGNSTRRHMGQDHVADLLEAREAHHLGRLHLRDAAALEARALDLGEIGTAFSVMPITTAAKEESRMPLSGKAK